MRIRRFIIYLAALVTASSFVNGCSNNSQSVSDSTVNPDISESSDMSDFSNTIEAIPAEQATAYQDKEQIVSIINSCSNLNASNAVWINIPQVDSVYEFVAKTTSEYDTDFEDYYNEFCEMFEYLFPGRTIDENYLFYSGGSSDTEYDENGVKIRDYNLVKDWYDKLISGEEGRVTLVYDEARNCDKTEYNSEIGLVLGSPIGFGRATINKGKSLQFSGVVYDEELGINRLPRLSVYDPGDWFEYVGTYSPHSTASFKLIDGEMPINEAVSFVENYINKLPHPEESNLDTCVVEVDVLKIDGNTYGYKFLTTKRYMGVNGDRMRPASYSDFGDYTFSGGSAFMIESGDVDSIISFYRRQNTENEVEYKNIISFENAIRIASNELTDEVVFEVQKVELVYAEELIMGEDGYADIVTYARNVTPTWKFTLYNSNDGKTYFCYIDAKDGGNFRYFSTTEKVDLMQ